MHNAAALMARLDLVAQLHLSRRPPLARRHAIHDAVNNIWSCLKREENASGC